ncbi:MAG: helicase-exonuclease AddAB subunit AddA, partial [Selenomonadales bacterium]|nr:helicase-exonuclease AddAB subunit AddA [Selenomonadales bacterium]
SGDGLTAVEREAVWIADYIDDLLSQGKVVYDKDLKDYRPLAKRDIVILLRSVKRTATVLLDALRVRGVSGYAEDDSGYFESAEIRIFLSLLNIIDNPHQDIPLAAVLRSPIVNMTEEELTEVRLAGEGDLYDALTISAQTMKKSAAFITKLDAWRTLARGRSVPELIWQLYQDTGYYDYVGGMANGSIRQANLEMLYDRAKAFEETDACGLFRFLRFIDKMLENDEDLGAAKDGGGENEDTVRIMSVHKSKGLEFPVVILANIGKQFNMQDMQKPILLHKSLGVGPYRVMAEERYRYPTLARLAIAQQTISENHAEELRVLYVAMTRAREKLVMVGSTKDIEAMREKWTLLARQDELSDSVIVGARSWLDWLAPVLAKHEAGFELRSEVMETEMTYRDSEALWRIDYHHVCLEKEETGRAEQAELIKRIKRMEAVDVGDDMADLDERLLWQYPNRAAVDLPAKLSVTEIKRRFAEHEEQAAVPFVKSADSYEKPRFLQTKKRLDAAEYGTMMHTVMQMIDLKGDLTAGGIKKQVDTLAERELIPADLAEEVDCEAVAAFFDLPLGKRMLDSK